MSMLRPNDLYDVVLPYLSIDEFKPKTTDAVTGIVVAFYCRVEPAAHDLKKFIETGRFNIIDVEASDVPDEKNRFLVFVEFTRNKDFMVVLLELLRDIENVTEEMRWVFSSVHSSGVKRLTPMNLKNHVILDQKVYAEIEARKQRQLAIKKHIESVSNAVNDFVIHSNIMSVEYRFRNGKKTLSFQYTDEDFDGKFDYKFYSMKKKSELAEDLEGVKSREGTIPTSILRPLTILFGDRYKIHNAENIIFVVPQFNNDYVLMLGV